MSQLPISPDYWLEQAANAKRAAERMHDYQARRALLLIAMGYEKMAEHALQTGALNLPHDRSEVDGKD